MLVIAYFCARIRMEYSHTPVMWQEIKSFLSPAAVGSCVFVDCTLGEGGHSHLMLQEFSKVKIVGFERDAEILRVARERLSDFSERIEFINANFDAVASHLSRFKGSVRAFLYDFGISSFHFEKSGRGFSFRDDEPLDMRLDGNCGNSAKDIVNGASEMELTEIISMYGQERWAKRIARAICRARREKPIETSRELAELVLRAIPARYHVRNIHPATRVFQALRIAVNDELSAIEKSLPAAIDILSPGGRICAISFHSLEDRIVKNAFKRAARGCTCHEEQCRCKNAPRVLVLTKKPVLPEESEIENNRRSRSARLRVAEKL